jgi:hypothetical protein
MKRPLIIFLLLAAVRAFGGGDGNVTVKLNDVSPIGTHTNIWFECSVTIHNGTSTTFFATNLFYGPPGLALKISDLGGKELKHLYADPYINFYLNTAIIPPGDITFKKPYGLGDRHLPLPQSVQTIRVRLDGRLSYTGYTNRLTSNFVEVNIP